MTSHQTRHARRLLAVRLAVVLRKEFDLSGVGIGRVFRDLARLHPEVLAALSEALDDGAELEDLLADALVAELDPQGARR
jgi:hypothetical protein